MSILLYDDSFKNIPKNKIFYFSVFSHILKTWYIECIKMIRKNNRTKRK